MNEINLRKKESHYQLILSKIIAEEVTNANVIGATITEVRLSNDGSHLKVYLTFSGNREKALQGLNNAKGFIRSQLAHSINTRKVPELHFHYDDLAEKAENLEKIFQKLKEENI